MNMRASILLVFVSAWTVGAAPQSPGDDAVQHAAKTVAHLHDTMLDPASFVLDAAFITKPNKHGEVSYCYAFRSHNRAGGFTDARATEDANDHLRLSTYTQDDGYGKFQGYDVGFIAPCKAKNIDREITGEVIAVASMLHQKSK
jgi:hypothetical protein